MSRHPEVKWAQREDKVFITVLLSDAKDPKVSLEPEGVFTFSATAGAGNLSYELKLDLFDKVNVEESKINIGPRSIFCILEKAESNWWEKLLRGDAKTPHYVKVDWDKWVDEDEDTGPSDLDKGGMDFSKLGGMPGMEGLEGMMGGMGGMGGLEGMMGGMPGMGGMGGMPGMGGMGGLESMMGGMGGMPGGLGNDIEDSDDKAEEVENPVGETKAEVAAEEKAEAPSST